MKKIFTIVLLFAVLSAGRLFCQDKNYTKISADNFWTSLTELKNKLHESGSKQFEFGEWQIFFPRMYINFVKKFSKNGGTMEYYVKVDAGGAFAPQIRFKDGPGKSSESYDDPSGQEEKLLLSELDEIITKIISSNGSTASLK